MCIDFNPRLREGGDIICIVGNSCIVNFNPRLREGGDKIDILFPPNKRYFNPRLREGGDVLWILLWILWITISIHASAKEATFPLYLLWMGKRFQSTPPRRRRPDFLFFLHGHDYFNPRLREGGDGFYWSKHCKRCLISIHASAKEATFEHLLYVLDEHIFQSTPPRRRRPRPTRPLLVLLPDFNPRLREGGDRNIL